MNHEAVYQFPDDDCATLEAVLLRVTCGLTSLPLEDVAVTCATGSDAMVLRMFGLPIPHERTLIVPPQLRPVVRSWIDSSELSARYQWQHLERFEFKRAADEQHLVAAIISITGERPVTMPLTFWPEIFRPNTPDR